MLSFRGVTQMSLYNGDWTFFEVLESQRARISASEFGEKRESHLMQIYLGFPNPARTGHGEIWADSLCFNNETNGFKAGSRNKEQTSGLQFNTPAGSRCIQICFL